MKARAAAKAAKAKRQSLYIVMSAWAFKALNPMGYARLVYMERRQRRVRIAPRGK